MTDDIRDQFRKGVIFDIDGVLLDSAKIYAKAAAVAYSQFFKTKITQKYAIRLVREIEKSENDRREDLIRAFFPPEIELSLEQFLRVYGSIWEKLCLKQARPFVGVTTFMRRLRRQGYRLGGISGRYMKSSETRQELQKFRILQLLDTLVLRSDARACKPAPDQLLLAAENLGLNNRSCIHVGDFPIDIEAARKAQMIPVAVHSGVYSRAELQRAGPSIILSRTVQLLGFLDKLQNTDSHLALEHSNVK